MSTQWEFNHLGFSIGDHCALSSYVRGLLDRDRRFMHSRMDVRAGARTLIVLWEAYLYPVEEFDSDRELAIRKLGELLSSGEFVKGSTPDQQLRSDLQVLIELGNKDEVAVRRLCVENGLSPCVAMRGVEGRIAEWVSEVAFFVDRPRLEDNGYDDFHHLLEPRDIIRDMLEVVGSDLQQSVLRRIRGTDSLFREATEEVSASVRHKIESFGGVRGWWSFRQPRGAPDSWHVFY